MTVGIAGKKNNKNKRKKMTDKEWIKTYENETPNGIANQKQEDAGIIVFGCIVFAILILFLATIF